MTEPIQPPKRAQDQGYLFGRFRLDLSSFQLWHDDEHLAITPKAFDTLVVLIKHRDRFVPKDELMNAVWPDAFVSEDNLTQAISVLRRTLGDDPNQPTFIATAARHGYRFIAPVHEVPIAGTKAETPAASGPGPVGGPSTVSPSASATRPRDWTSIDWPSGRWLVAPACLGLLLIVGIVARSMMVARAVPSGGPLRFAQEPPGGTQLVSGGALSSDGRSLLFVARDDRSGRNHLWVRILDAAESRMLADTQDASRPFWSPDGRFAAFFANGKLKRVGLNAEPVQTIAQVSVNAEGGSWSTSGMILFAAGRSGLYLVPSQGGTPVPVTTLNPSTREVAHRWPQFLPDGRHFLYFVESVNPEHAGTYLGSVDSPNKTRVLDVAAVYAPPHHLLHIRDRVLMAQNFDASSGRVSGPASTLGGDVIAPDISNAATLTASSDGLLTFSVSKVSERFTWFSRSGQLLGTVDAPVTFRNPALLPNQRELLAASNGDAEHKGLWMFDVDRRALTRVATEGMRPFASPDGSQIAFTSDRKAGVADLYVRPLAGRDGDERLLLTTKDNKFICDWSPDGRYIVYGSTNARTGSDLWLLPLFGDRQPRPFLQTPSNEICGQVSSDGRWIAYASDESGAWEVYIQSFPEPGDKQDISVGGGIEPHWRRDGRELFYLAADRNVIAVEITPGSILKIGPRTALFRAPVASLNPYVNQYAVAADGQRFVIDAAEEHKRNQELITVVVNWTALLQP